MVIKTELCAFSEWKIYPGRGIRYVAKDGRPFLFLSKRTKDFGLRYTVSKVENSKLKDSDGQLPGEDSTKNLNYLIRAKIRRRKCSENKEPLRVSLLKILKKSKLLALKIKRHLLTRLSARSRRERELWLPRRPPTRRLSPRTRMFSKKLKIRLPKKVTRKLSPRRNDRLLFKIHN